MADLGSVAVNLAGAETYGCFFWRLITQGGKRPARKSELSAILFMAIKKVHAAKAGLTAARFPDELWLILVAGQTKAGAVDSNYSKVTGANLPRHLDALEY